MSVYWCDDDSGQYDEDDSDLIDLGADQEPEIWTNEVEEAEIEREYLRQLTGISDEEAEANLVKLDAMYKKLAGGGKA